MGRDLELLQHLRLFFHMISLFSFRHKGTKARSAINWINPALCLGAFVAKKIHKQLLKICIPRSISSSFAEAKPRRVTFKSGV